ncbi:MAG: Lrp/AsnC family transcriptional regulator [Chloroflexi bacterium]|nr:Lrp/AsnC family transcriptional regulator [Chloroflexota bacterium]
MYKPDQIDWQIISFLNDDGRMTSTEIARKIGDVSSRTISNRIDTLIRQGIINIRAIVNPETVGYRVLADVYIEVEPGRVREVATLVAELPQVSYVAAATGENDVSISLRVRTIEELFDFVNEKLGRISGVRRTQSHILPFKIKDLDTWLPPNVLDARDGNSR